MPAASGIAIAATEVADQHFFSVAGPADYLGTGFPWTACWSWFGLCGVRRIDTWVVRATLMATPPEPRQEGTARISSSTISAKPSGAGYEGLRIDIIGADGSCVQHDIAFRQAIRKPDSAGALWDPRLYHTARGWVWFDVGCMRHITGAPRLSDVVDLAEDLIAVTVAGRSATAAVRAPSPVLGVFPWSPGWLWWQQHGIRRFGHMIVRICPNTVGSTDRAPRDGTGSYSRTKPVGSETCGIIARIVGRGGFVVEHPFAFCDYIAWPADATAWDPRLYETSRGMTWFDSASMRSLGQTVDTAALVAGVESYLALVCGDGPGAAQHQRSGGYMPDELLVITDG